MPEHLLYGSEVGSTVEEVGGRRVPQGVRAGRTGAGQIRQESGDQPVHGTNAQPFALSAEKESRIRSMRGRGQCGPAAP